MNNIPAQWIIIAAALAVAVIVLAVWFSSQRKKETQRLQDRFGPEYAHAVTEFGSRAKAESALKEREKRVESFDIIALAPADATRFAQAWVALQGRFVDNPKATVVQADQLVRELMLKRRYPVSDFELRAADISVHYPGVVENYRAAQAIAVRNERGEADTEALRKAIVHYRALFDELLEVRETRGERVAVDGLAST
jgi:hypothetical protein